MPNEHVVTIETSLGAFPSFLANAAKNDGNARLVCGLNFEDNVPLTADVVACNVLLSVDHRGQSGIL